MSVPLIVTRSEVVARGANESDAAITGAALMPFTRPVIIAVDPLADGPVGESEPDAPPHAMLAAITPPSARIVHARLLTVMSFLLPRNPAG
jgi:hypothetical protein